MKHCPLGVALLTHTLGYYEPLTDFPWSVLRSKSFEANDANVARTYVVCFTETTFVVVNGEKRHARILHILGPDGVNIPLPIERLAQFKSNHEAVVIAPAYATMVAPKRKPPRPQTLLIEHDQSNSGGFLAAGIKALAQAA